MVDTLNQPLTKETILLYHKIIKQQTIDDGRGLIGRWKKIPNMMTGFNIAFTDPEEVETKIEELLTRWETSWKALDDIIQFHIEFERIHPVQDANGRLGRIIMLKQCIENGIDIIMIDKEHAQHINLR